MRCGSRKKRKMMVGKRNRADPIFACAACGPMTAFGLGIGGIVMRLRDAVGSRLCSLAAAWLTWNFNDKKVFA